MAFPFSQPRISPSVLNAAYHGARITLTTTQLAYVLQIECMKKVLVACECSQVVTMAFRAAGASAWSCDLMPCYGGHPEWHFQCDVTQLLHQKWDLVIAHPPCTMLSKVSGVALSKGLHTMEMVREARNFFMLFTQLDCPTCIENPIPLRVAELPPYTQLICPSHFGHPFTKKTALWLFNLPPLLPMSGYYIKAPSWVLHCNSTMKRRSRFWEGIAEAMAAQWLPLI